MRSAKFALLAVLVAAPTVTAAGPKRAERKVDDVVTETIAILDEKIEQREAALRGKMRAAYKKVRLSNNESWLQPQARVTALRWRTSVRQIVRRDQYELDQLKEERQRVTAERGWDAHGPHAEPPEASLAPPVNPVRIARRYGVSRTKAGLRIVRPGLLLRVGPEDPVRASAAGVVSYAGELGTLGSAVVIDHGGYLTVVGKLRSVQVASGDEVVAEQQIAQAAGERLYFEVRVAGLGPIDPRPLLAR